MYRGYHRYVFLNCCAADLDFEQDTKMGAIDFETYGVNGYGTQNVYAGGWCTKNLNSFIILY